VQHGGRSERGPLIEDNLVELFRRMREYPDIPVTLTEGCCMVCDPCNVYHRGENLCYHGHIKSSLRDLMVLERLGLPAGRDPAGAEALPADLRADRQPEGDLRLAGREQHGTDLGALRLRPPGPPPGPRRRPAGPTEQGGAGKHGLGPGDGAAKEAPDAASPFPIGSRPPTHGSRFVAWLPGFTGLARPRG